MTRSDRELVDAYKSGEQGALREIVQRHQRMLWRAAFAVLKNEAEAEDAVQVGLERAWRNIGSFRGDSALSSWLYTIVIRASFEQIKSRSGTVVLDTGVEPADPADSYSRAETQLDLERALKQLPEELFGPIFLLGVRGWSVAETAQALDIPEGTVKTRCARARLRLKGDLE